MSDEIEFEGLESSGVEYEKPEDGEKWVEQSFTISVRFKENGTDMPEFAYLPQGDNIKPHDCITLCAQGTLWAVQAQRRLEQEAVRQLEMHASKRTGQKTDRRIILPSETILQ